MFRFPSSCSWRWLKGWLFFYVVALLVALTCCYDPCPESLRRSGSAKAPNIPKSEIEKAFVEAEKIVNNKTEQERRLVREGKVVNKKVKSAASTHQQAFVNPQVRSMEVRQRPFQEASSILAQKYNLPQDEVCCSLPKADLSTPAAARAVQNCINPQPISCDSASRYRTADGTCNNLNNPTWGSAFACFNRLLPAAYTGNEEFRRSVSGGLLPQPRTLSLNIHSHRDNPTNYVNHLYMFFGQLLDHDVTLTAASTTVDNEAIECCPISNDSHPQCAPIQISSNDYFYSQFGITCLNFVRSAICDYCTAGPRAQANQVTAFVDASFVYGNSDNVTNGLRDNNTRGNLRVQRSQYGDLLPPSDDPANDQCSLPDQNLTCFQTGDLRGNQHPPLTSLHTVFLKEHNRIATVLRSLNPGWNAERVFQEARKIVGAEMQVITFKEYLPVTLGNERMDYFGLCVNPYDHRTVYDPAVDPTLVTEFSTAGFRFGHSMINDFIAESPGQPGHNGHFLRNVFFSPFDLYNGEIDLLMKGATNSASQYFDRHVVQDVTNYLYRIQGNDTGFDLPAFNIQRGRDHGLQPYVDVVRFCSEGQVDIRTFEDLHQLMSSENVDRLRINYRNEVRDIDLWVGILNESWKSGAVVGPTAICLIGIQFHKLKFGDRFYFEHEGVFSAYQLRELKKVTLAKILCDNTGIQEIQRSAMLYKSHNNQCQACTNLPDMNLSYWKE